MMTGSMVTVTNVTIHKRIFSLYYQPWTWTVHCRTIDRNIDSDGRNVGICKIVFRNFAALTQFRSDDFCSTRWHLSWLNIFMPLAIDVQVSRTIQVWPFWLVTSYNTLPPLANNCDPSSPHLTFLHTISSHFPLPTSHALLFYDQLEFQAHCVRLYSSYLRCWPKF